MAVQYVMPKNAHQQEMILRCIRSKIPMVEKFEYPNGVETSVGYMTLTYEKRGYYHYLNGKRVARNFVLDAHQYGLITC
jgi:hypothetical protein